MIRLPISKCLSVLFVAWVGCFGTSSYSLGQSHPNVVIVIADDQGYGDLGHTGNPVIQTPNIDALAKESSSLTDYHVAPTCSPTRSALMTGHWTNRTGVWHTINGRSMLRANEVTLGSLFRQAGYTTGMFGKWHLGDNYPYRPEDRGFEEVYRHGGGGVGQTPDVWNNSYFDGAYFHNGEIESAEGFCTDVFFNKAGDFIRESAQGDKPFLAYISTNAPHGPLHCPQEYMDRYSDQPDRIAAFFGMITNIDDNVARTRKLLDELDITDDTIFIFTTDNGTATGSKVFNASMRGAKGSPYEGGHRVPFFMHWPAAGMAKPHVSNHLCHAVDVAPTLLDLCDIRKPDDVQFDGVSIRNLLDPNAETGDPMWTERILVTDSQRVRDPIKWRQSSVMQGKWRLVNRVELYNIETDPSQSKNVHDAHPEQVTAMQAFYDQWWTELEPTFAETTEIIIGHPEHGRVSLTAHDWIQEAMPPWNQGQIRQGNLSKGKRKKGVKTPPANQPKLSQHQGHWAIEVVNPGSYRVQLRRWPAEADRAIVSSAPAEPNVPGADQAFRARPGIAIGANQAVLRIDGEVLGTKPVKPTDTHVAFTAVLETGSHQLSPYFETATGQVGAYYCIVESVNDK